MEVRALSWNLFHGRDHPPERELNTWRSRLWRMTERSETHAQVNRDIYAQFRDLIADADWDVALLQEVPPRYAEALTIDSVAEPHMVLTSRNVLPVLQGAIARLNPDLIASWEGGANLTLVRPRLEALKIVERRDLLLTRTPERRRMAFTRLAGGLCIANLHASAGPGPASREVMRAAATAYGWAAGAPLIFGGDLNSRPAVSAALFNRLSQRYDLTGATSDQAIDHLLSHGLELLEPANQWQQERRELPDPTHKGPGQAKAIRLSDHAPVAAAFVMPAADS